MLCWVPLRRWHGKRSIDCSTVSTVQDVELDLVVVEFTVNDYPDVSYTDPQRKGYEQLLRKLLRMPGPPAVVQLHHYAWWRSLGDGVDAGLFYYPQAEAQHYVFSQVGCCSRAAEERKQKRLRRAAGARRGGAGDPRMPPLPALCCLFSVRSLRAACAAACPAVLPQLRNLPALAALLLPARPQYYDVPSVSLRSATWHLMNGGVPPFEVCAPSLPSRTSSCPVCACTNRLVPSQPRASHATLSPEERHQS